jgi:DNA primase catalytic subunit
LFTAANPAFSSVALVDGPRVRVITEDGELIRELVLDPDRDYQPHGRS